MRDVNFILKILAALPLCAFVVVFAITGDVADSLLCTIGTASLCVVALPVLFTRPFDVFHPFALLMLSILLGTAGKAFYLVFSRSNRWFFLTEGRTATWYIFGSLLILGACFCMTFGYFVAGRFQISLGSPGRTRPQLSTRRLLIFAVLTIPVSTFATVQFLNRTGFEANDGLSSISQKRSVVVDESAAFGQQTTALGYHRLLAGTLPATASIALMITLCFQPVTSSSKVLWSVAGLCFIAACCLPFVTSSRKSIIFLLLDILLVLNYTGRLKASHMLFGLLAACSIGTLMLAIRVAEDSSFSEGSGNALEHVADALFGTTNYLEITKTSVMHRSLPKVMEYEYGATYLGVLFTPIPRELYPEKPAVSPAPKFAKEAFGHSRGRGGGVPPGFVGETMWNFSIWSVWPITFLYGAALRILYNSFVPFVRYSPTSLLVYIGILLPVTFEFVGGSVAGCILSSGQRLVFLILIILFASQWTRHPSSVATHC